MKGLNLNAVQTYLTAIITALPVLLVSLGCTQSITGALDCSASVISPAVAAYIVAALGFVKLVALPAIQPGGWFNNLFAVKVPVVPSIEAETPGTVTPAQVAK